MIIWTILYGFHIIIHMSVICSHLHYSVVKQYKCIYMEQNWTEIWFLTVCDFRSDRKYNIVTEANYVLRSAEFWTIRNSFLFITLPSPQKKEITIQWTFCTVWI